MFHDQTTVRGMPNSTKRLKLRVDVNLNFNVGVKFLPIIPCFIIHDILMGP